VNFLLRRICQGMLQILGVSVLAFALLELAPGDYLDDMRVNPQISQAAMDRWRQQFGMDQGPVTRYFRWSSSFLRGEFGQSMAYGIPVSDLVWDRVWNTMRLSGTALLLCWLAAVPLGVVCGAYRRGWVDRAAGGLASVFLSLPDLLVGLIVLGVAVRWGIGPLSGKLLPPALALACVSFPAVFRHTRSSVQQVLRMPFIDHLRACGVSEHRIVFVHSIRAAANPMISLLGLSLAALTSSSLVIEVTMSWPGLGPLLLEAILARDVAVVLAAVLLSSALLLIGNIVADLLLFAADPRIRTESL
jgi:peptide/nickel transport system permease protein